jgi:hypothetical protein
MELTVWEQSPGMLHRMATATPVQDRMVVQQWHTEGSENRRCAFYPLGAAARALLLLQTQGTC